MGDDQANPDPGGGQPVDVELQDELELVEGEIVLASPRSVEPLRETQLPLRPLAAAAATGFVAGAATAAVLGRRLAARSQAGGRAATPAAAAAPLEAPATRRFVVHVYALARR